MNVDEIRTVVLQEAERFRVREKPLLSVKDAAQMIGLSERTVRELITRGEIPTRVVEPYNRVLIARVDLDAWIESLPRRDASEKAS